jgi:hypothetical protein
MAVGYCDECRRVFIYSASEDAMCHACQNDLSDLPDEEMDRWISIASPCWVISGTRSRSPGAEDRR